MSMKNDLIREYLEKAQQESNARAAARQKKFDTWIEGELRKLKNGLLNALGDTVEYNITCCQNVHAEIAPKWKPYVEIVELRAKFKHNGAGLVMSPMLDESLPDDWRHNPLNANAPKASIVTSRAEVGCLLRQWEKADWTIYDWSNETEPQEDEWVQPEKIESYTPRFLLCETKEINDLFHDGVKFTLHSVDVSEYGGAWFVELHSVEVGQVDTDASAEKEQDA